jgi:hypothetical protein
VEPAQASMSSHVSTVKGFDGALVLIAYTSLSILQKFSPTFNGWDDRLLLTEMKVSALFDLLPQERPTTKN